MVDGHFREEQFSLRLGHARVLTPHRGVIHYARAASLPPLQSLCAFRLCGGRRLSRTRDARPYRMSAFFVGDGLARPVTINKSRIVWRGAFVFGGSNSAVGAQTMPIFALNFGTGQRLSHSIKQTPDLKSFGGVGPFFKRV